MKRLLILAYGFINYIVTMGIIIYSPFWLIGMAPHGVDDWHEESFWFALGVNVVLMLVFFVQHTVQARAWYKGWYNRHFNPATERTTYIFDTNVAFLLIFWQWRSSGGIVWDVENTVGVWLLWGLFVFGWAIALLSISIKNHFHFLGLSQAWLYFLGKDQVHEKLKRNFLYSFVRHPMYFGFLLGYWAVPTMTDAHFQFAVMFTVYTIIGIQFEERLLIRYIGDGYRDYQKRVPALIPFTRFGGGG